MSMSPFTLMQAAVDIVNSSRHPTSKIAATLAGTDAQGQDFHVSRTNFWPEPILRKLGMERRIGNSSGTIHAETHCILSSPRTDGASLFVTDPFCPNCAKNIAEAGIRRIYIDHKGFVKDFAARRGDHFDNMSLQICEKAGISVYEIRRKEEKIIPILEIPEGYVPSEDNPVEIEPAVDGTLHIPVLETPFAAALAVDPADAQYRMTSLPHAAVGYTMDRDAGDISGPQGKYTFIIEPVNRLLMTAARHSLKIRDIYSSRVPTAREQVNLVGAGLARIAIGDLSAARDADALAAKDLLSRAGILDFVQNPIS